MSDHTDDGSITVTYRADIANISEAMRHATLTLMTARQRVFYRSLLLVQPTLIFAGAIGVVWVLYIILGFGILLPFPLIVLGVLIGWVVERLGCLGMRWIAAAVARMQAPEGTEMRFSASGVELAATGHKAQLDWSAIHNLALGKTALMLGVSGASMPVPRSAFDDAEAAFARISAWRDAAGVA